MSDHCTCRLGDPKACPIHNPDAEGYDEMRPMTNEERKDADEFLSESMKDNSEVFFTIDNKEYCDEELALSILLKEGALFCGERRYAEYNNDKLIGKTIVVYVVCSDIFAWGCADAEDLPLDELSNFYKMWKTNSKWGTAKWCCFRRKEKPQHPVAEAMKNDGSWDDEMEKLSENHYDAYCKSSARRADHLNH